MQCRPSRAVSSLTVSVLGKRSLLRGASPRKLGSVGAHGVRGGSTSIALHRSWSVSAIFTYVTWGSGRRFIIFLRDVPHDFLAKNLSVYLTYTCTSLNNPVELGYLDTCCAEDWVDLGSPSSHFQDSVDCADLWGDSRLLRHPAIDVVWRWPCLPCFRLL